MVSADFQQSSSYEVHDHGKSIKSGIFREKLHGPAVTSKHATPTLMVASPFTTLDCI